MYRTFNMGIGMTIVADEKVSNKIIKFFNNQVVLIGEITNSKIPEVEIV